MRIFYSLLALAVCACCTGTARAEVLDTLSNYRPTGNFVYYRDPQITMQAARFMTAAPGAIRNIHLTLGGVNGDGSVMLHIYGHEGGGTAPQLQKDLVRPILVRKTRPGVEKITITLPNPVTIENDQFFIGVDNISPGITLLSDQAIKQPNCSSTSDAFYYQFLKLDGHRWRWGTYAYVIDVVMEYSEQVSRGYLVDVTGDIGITDSALANHSIAWADYNSDGYLDLLAGGKLYQNSRGERFTDVTDAAGISGQPQATAFADFNNDRYIDVLFIGSMDSSNPESWIYVNNGDNTFNRRLLDLPSRHAPTSLNVADVSGDGFLDIFIGQGNSATNLLLTSNRDLTFTDRSYWLYVSDTSRAGSLGSQWVDYDSDGRLDLFVANTLSASELWQNAGDSTFANVSRKSISLHQMGESIGRGCDWADYDNDGDLDLLLPNTVSMRNATDIEGSGTLIYSNSGAPDYELVAAAVDNGIRYEEKHTGGAWGDVNNDGLMDVIITTSSPCRYADIYVQGPGNRFQLATSDYGLHQVAAGNDAVWVDYDNDGQLDIATIDNGRFRLLRNNGLFNNSNYVELDLASPSGNGGGAGATVTVFAGGIRYTQQVSAGRGILMAKPLRLHFGLDNARVIDSVAILWPNSSTPEVVRQLAVNTVHRIGAVPGGTDGTNSIASLDAAPNPFSTTLTITYTIPSDRHVRLAIYTADGSHIVTLIDEKQRAGSHSVTWDTRDGNGQRMAKGAYIYRLISDGIDLNGRAVLVQ